MPDLDTGWQGGLVRPQPGKHLGTLRRGTDLTFAPVAVHGATNAAEVLVIRFIVWSRQHPDKVQRGIVLAPADLEGEAIAGFHIADGQDGFACQESGGYFAMGKRRMVCYHDVGLSW